MQTAAASRRRIEQAVRTTVQNARSPTGFKSNNAARHHAPKRDRCFARLNTTADARRKSPPLFCARTTKPPLRGGDRIRNFARPFATTGIRAKSKTISRPRRAEAKPAHRAPTHNHRFAAEAAAPSLRAFKKPPLRGGDLNRRVDIPLATRTTASRYIWRLICKGGGYHWGRHTILGHSRQQEVDNSG